MSCYKYPNTYNGTTFSWNSYSMNHIGWSTILAENIGMLFWELGKSGNLNMSYGIDGSWAYMDRVPPTFQNFGYYSSGDIGYKFAPIKTNIAQGHPVIVSGSNKKKDGDAHAWVVDQIGQARTYVTITYIYYYQGKQVGIVHGGRHLRQSIDVMHCNMGWGGSSNMWAYDGLFTPPGGYDFTYKNTMIVDIHPR